MNGQAVNFMDTNLKMEDVSIVKKTMKVETRQLICSKCYNIWPYTTDNVCGGKLYRYEKMDVYNNENII